jgi:hypothetical protein
MNLKYLIPMASRNEIYRMFIFGLIGSLMSGLYGILHDHITYSISSEYFTNLKFQQFRYAIIEGYERVSVTIIGFLATWWVGFFCGWFLARWYIPGQSRYIACRQVYRGFISIFICSILFGVLGGLYGYLNGSDIEYDTWNPLFEKQNIQNKWGFVRVAYIHNLGYFGALVGFLATFLFQRRLPKIA